MGEHFLHLPPGFRFHPSDEELIVHYLRNKVKQRSLPASVIGEINLYNFDPWDLPNKASFGKDEWFFFTPRDKKYPNGTRPNRSARSGFWKATEKDKPILGSSGSIKIGLKKALAFFTGSPTSSKKTNWIMIEYRLPESSSQSSISMRLDDWVLCRIRQKGNNSKNISQVQEYSNNKSTHGQTPTMAQVQEYLNNKSTHGQTPTMAQELHSPYMITNPRFNIVSNSRFKEIQLMASILVGQGIPSLTKTCSPKLLQRDNTSFEYENGAIYKENFTFEQGWIV